MSSAKYFQLFVATGGTFTDCIGIDNSGIEYRQKIIRKNGEEIRLDLIQNINLEAGDKFIIETPGGPRIWKISGKVIKKATHSE